MNGHDTLMSELCDDNVAPERKAELLSAVKDEDVTGEMLAASARFLLSRAVSLPGFEDALDVCGTGGDKGGKTIKTFNISTAAAFVAAAAGVPVVKHGNRAVSSFSGSSDVLEALGVPVASTAAEALGYMDRHNLSFVSAPAFHPALVGLAPVRRSLGRPTFFNLLGPLCNPARTRRQVIGVYDGAFARPMAEAARLLGKTDVIILHSDDGLDEISTAAPTLVCHLKDGKIAESRVSPEDCGVVPSPLEGIEGGDAAKNARIIEGVFRGALGPAHDIVCLNAGAALVAAHRAVTLREGVRVASETVGQGLALRKLEDMRRAP